MTYESVDALQRTLADTVFQDRVDRKKAAGRALGTFVELVTFYTLRAWDLLDHVVIERSVPEFGNPQIVHNVEFSLHPVRTRWRTEFGPIPFPLTAAKIRRRLPELAPMPTKSNCLLDANRVKRNACVVAEDSQGLRVANVKELVTSSCEVDVCELSPRPFAVFECKRVGVEEGMTRGPQTIEKAKQGAYVARTVSSLQKVRLRDGRFQGVLEQGSGDLRLGSYEDLLRELIDAADAHALEGFVLTVGVVSNHGNWFTSENQNKELRVLGQSYDWLLFLTDQGLSQFIDRLLLNPQQELEAARTAFLTSYAADSRGNQFTKVKIAAEADAALQRYFTSHASEVESWFNVISPRSGRLESLREDLCRLSTKNWFEADRV